MFMSHMKKVVLGLVIISFTSTSFAAWVKNRNHVNCVGNTCHKTSVHKACYHGNCKVVRHSGTWHR